MAVTGSSPRVQYTYSELASGTNHSRLTSIIYPNGRVLNYNYAAGLDDAISRLSSLSDSTGVLESYDYLGESVVVARKHPQPGIDLSYIKRSGEANGDAGDQYTGLDRFGRIVDQRWLESSDGSAVDRLQYSYDRNGNRLSRTNLVNAAFSESYSYDDLNQLTGFSRGSHTRSWDYDAQGNWESVTTDGSTQTRSHNAQNEITGISGAVTPTFDANGNLTRDETGRQFVYDAWNRLVAVKDASGNTLKSYAYDGLHRRISETAGGTTTDFYYSDAWQVLEERVTSHGRQSVGAQYVWSPIYVDAMVLRDRDTNGDGTLDERLWVVQDANYNVTALFDNSGSVVERYVYDPFGQVTVLDADWNVRAGSNYAWLHLHQGGRFDSTSGLYHFRFRDYSPTLGRWTSLDPIRYAAGDVNLYRALGNDLLNRLDPLGLADWELKWEWHHMFPQEFRDQFPNFDFDAPENGRMMRGGPHRGAGGLHSSGWNEEWAKWINDRRNKGLPITPEDIRKKAEEMMNSDTYKKFFEDSKPATERWNVRAERLAREKAAREAAERAAKEEAERVAKQAAQEAAEKGMTKVAKKGLKFAASKIGGPVTAVIFFAYDWHSTGSFGEAVNEAVWPLSELWKR